MGAEAKRGYFNTKFITIYSSWGVCRIFIRSWGSISRQLLLHSVQISDVMLV